MWSSSSARGYSLGQFFFILSINLCIETNWFWARNSSLSQSFMRSGMLSTAVEICKHWIAVSASWWIDCDKRIWCECNVDIVRLPLSVVLSWIKVRLVLKCMKMSRKRRYECLEHVLVTHSTFHYQMVAQCKLNWLVCLELEFQSNMVLDIRFCPEEFCSSAFILDCVRMICTQCIDWMLPALLIHFHDIRQPLELSHQQFHARNDSCLIHALFSFINTLFLLQLKTKLDVMVKLGVWI